MLIFYALIWLLASSFLLVVMACAGRAGHVEDVARGYVADIPSPRPAAHDAAPAVVRSPRVGTVVTSSL